MGDSCYSSDGNFRPSETAAEVLPDSWLVVPFLLGFVVFRSPLGNACEEARGGALASPAHGKNRRFGQEHSFARILLTNISERNSRII